MQRYCVCRIDIATGFAWIEPKPWRHMPYLGQAQRFQQPYIGPTEVELPPTGGKARRCAMGMVVVVQFLAPDHYSPRNDVARGVPGGEIAVAPVVAEAIDDAGSEKRNPNHLHGPQRKSDGADENQIDDEHDDDAGTWVPPVKMAFEPVVMGAPTVFLQRLRIRGFDPVEFRTGEQDLSEAPDLWAMGVFRSLALSVVLAVDCHPDPGFHSGGQPKPEAEKLAHHRMQRKRMMRLMAMEKHRDGYDGDMRESQRKQ